jgi:serine/threonine protein kinase
VKLFSDRKFQRRVNLEQSVGDFFVSEENVLYVRVPSISIHFHVTGRKDLRRDIPLSDRVFDVKRKLVAKSKRVSTVQLFIGPYITDDQVCIGELGLSNQSLIRVNILRQGVGRFYFRDLEGEPRSLLQPADRVTTFGSLANSFLKDNAIEVGYMLDGRVLKRSTLLKNVLCDPHVPIYVIRRPLKLPLIFEGYTQWNKELQVTCDMRVENVIDHIKQGYSIRNLLLRVNGHDAPNPNRRLIDLDPELEEPIKVQKISLDSHLSPTIFAIQRNWLKVVIPSQNPTCLDAKEALGRELSVPASCLSLRLDHRLLDDTAHMPKAKICEVEISGVTRQFRIELIPTSAWVIGWSGKYVRQVAVELGEAKLVGDLAAYLSAHQYVGPIHVAKDRTSPFVDTQLLCHIPEGATISIRYHPKSLTHYQFPLINNRGCLFPCPAEQSTTVLQVKMSLLIADNQSFWLPGTLSISFWGCELADNNRILDYGIPATSIFDVAVNASEKLLVLDPSKNRSEYMFGQQDTVGSLLEALRFKRIERGDIVVYGDGREQNRSKLLKDLQRREVRWAPRPPLRPKDFKSMKEIRPLGKGTFGVAILVEDPATHQLIALKSIQLKEPSAGTSQNGFIGQVEIFGRLTHPCLLEIVGYSLPVGNNPAIIGTKYAANGSLGDAIKQRRRIDDTGLAIIVCGIVLGMRFIHSKNLVHGDLKPSNVLLDECNYARIGDAGLTQLLGKNIVTPTQIGSPFYLSPEMYEGAGCGKPADVYSFALILFELLAGRPAFAATSALAVLKKNVQSGVRPELPQTINATVKDIIKKGWERDPEVRYSFDEIWWRLASIDFQLTGNVDPSQVSTFISWAGMPPVTTMQFTVEMAGGPVTLDVPSDCTISALVGLLAERLTVEVSLISGELLSNPDQKILSVPGPIRFEIKGQHHLPSRVIGDWERDFQPMKEVRSLGQGRFGIVTLVQDLKTHDLIALKSIRFDESSDSQKAFSDFTTEIERLVHLIHPCVLEIVGYSLPADNRPGQIGTRFAANGSLAQVFEQRQLGKALEFMDDTGIAVIVCGIVLGMQFIHSQNLIHRNLKPSNILLDESGFARIGDLGNSRLDDLGVTHSKGVGSVLYMAPEMADGGDYTSSVDVYSFALILYELLTRKPVFLPNISCYAIVQQAKNDVRPAIPSSMNEKVKDIIQKSWAADPKVRYSFYEIWSRLEGINFQLTPYVNCARVAEFIASVSKTVPLPGPQPITDLRPYAFQAPQQGLDPSFVLPCAPLATVKVVRKQVAEHLGKPEHEERVQLLFGGRILRDPLILDNLQMEEDDVIIVYLRKYDDPGFAPTLALKL